MNGLERTAGWLGRRTADVAALCPPLQRKLEHLAQWMLARWAPAAICPCGHARSQHYAGRDQCLACAKLPPVDANGRPARLACQHYAGPWPVHHLHVATRPCEECGLTGAHWSVELNGVLVPFASFQLLPGEAAADRVTRR
jgi:hypothetical protein